VHRRRQARDDRSRIAAARTKKLVNVHGRCACGTYICGASLLGHAELPHVGDDADDLRRGAGGPFGRPL
jgi:hypothetical protein